MIIRKALSLSMFSAVVLVLFGFGSCHHNDCGDGHSGGKHKGGKHKGGKHKGGHHGSSDDCGCDDDSSDDGSSSDDSSDSSSACTDDPICPTSSGAIQCGGFANIQCPGALTCIDDPNDSCDPNNGGADCGGICEDLVYVGNSPEECTVIFYSCDPGYVPFGNECGCGCQYDDTVVVPPNRRK